jgi:hypothetical protein
VNSPGPQPIGPIVARITARALAPSFPTPEAELAYAVARGSMALTLAEVSVLARYKDLGEAHQRIAEMRRSITVWRHIHDQLRRRIHELTITNARARLPWNVIMARAHDINASQTLDEAEVTAIAEAAVYETLPDRRRRHGA